VLFCLNGGPGLPCDYLRATHAPFADQGFRVVIHDQLGTGASDHPDDPALWTIGRYVEEVETVRRALGLGKVHLLGHSWGGWLAIEYAVTYHDNLETLILTDTCADMPHLARELDRLRDALGPETVAMMQRHEAEGTYDHPEYAAAVKLLDQRHIRRLDEMPAPVKRSREGFNFPIYMTMQGPNEYHYIGNLKDWNRVPELPRITVPTLILVGMYDAITPACALRMKQALPNAELTVFRNSSHSPAYEEPEAYARRLGTFLAEHRGK
jgi:proline iminopeptidase